MALQIWCPFTSDTRQQGLGDISIPISASQGSIVTNGKLGKCLKTTATGNIETTYIPDLNNSNYSIGGWFKFNKSELQTALSNLDYTSIKTYAIGNLIGNNSFGGLGLCWNSNDMYASSRVFNRLDIFGCLRTSSAGVQNVGTIIVDFDVWMHIFLVFDKIHKTLSLYKNGSLIQSKTITDFSDGVSRKLYINYSAVTAGNGPGACIPFYMNDFRLYNHALSPKEIEILSRGLVAHYPLNNNGGGQPNLYDFESVASKWKVTTGAELTLVDAIDDIYGNVLKITTPSSVSSERIYRGVSNVWKADTNFTVSFLAKASKPAVMKIERSRTDYAPDVTVGTTWKRYSTVIPCSATTTGGALGIQTSTASADIYITQIKLELGDKATAYQPGVGDSHYVPLGYDSTTEYDVSGYGYNGTKNGTIAYLTDTPRYNVSTNIKGASSYIKIPNLTTTGFSNSYSFAWWGKVPSYQGYMMWGFSDGQRLNGIFNGNLWNTGDGASNPLYVPGTTTQVTVPTTNTWHHFVMTGDGTTCKVYQDGVLWGQAKTYKSISGTTIYINGWDAGTSYTYGDYQMSDVRIYATALSATQVAELYNTAVSVANNGSLLGYELVEV